MAKVFVEDSTLTSIANAIRKKTSTSATMQPTQMPGMIQSIVTADGIDYDTFWDQFQGADGIKSYIYAFAYDRFNDRTYNPKHPIICAQGTATAGYMFSGAKSITDTKVPIDVTNLTNNAPLTNTFNSASALEKIHELIVKASNTYPGTFGGCTSLRSITITGTIGNDISFKDCPLNSKSLQSIINALADLTGKEQKTLTLSSGTYYELVSDTTRAQIEAKNWIVKE